MPAIDFASLSVLVVDDQDFVRTIVKKMLEQIGVRRVMEAKDGGEGLRMVIEGRPDLVICDVQMRPMNGLDFLASLRRTQVVGAVPVIMLSAHTDAATIQRARELGVDGFLGKPVLPKTLKERMEQALRA